MNKFESELRQINEESKFFSRKMPGRVLNLDFNKRLGNDIVRRFNALTTITPGPSETFEEAVARHNMSETDIAQRLKQLLFQSRVCYGGTAAAAIGSLYFGYAGSISGFISALAVVIVTATSANAYAFRAWQIANRKLGGVNTWFRNPGLWFQ